MKLRGIIALVLSLSANTAHCQTPANAVPPALSCPGDAIVWVNTRSHVYHYKGERYFGNTKSGRFMCEKAARTEGDRPTKNGQ